MPKPLMQLAVATPHFAECFIVEVVPRNCSLESFETIAARACRQVLGASPAVPATSFEGCIWDISLPDDDEDSCYEALLGRMNAQADWSNRMRVTDEVYVPVSLPIGDIFFVPRGEDTVEQDSVEFCNSSKVMQAGCAEAVAAAARAVYARQLEPSWAHGPRASLCPARSLVPSVGASDDGVGCRPDAPLVAFYHVATPLGGPWRGIVAEQVEALRSSGLLGALEAVHVQAAGSRADVEAALAAAHPPGQPFQLLPTNSSLSAYGYPTLAALHALCRRRPEALVLYLHNKGASRGGEKQRAARAWRLYMEHFVLQRHAACLGVLAAGYDTCGVQWAEDWSMYGGNMWWARCDFIAELPEVEALPTFTRFNAEKWLGLGGGDRGFCPVSCAYVQGRSLYYEEISPAEYEGLAGCDAALRGGHVAYWEVHHPVRPERNASLTYSSTE